MILKALSKLDEHFTLSIKDNGTFDFHHTKEGIDKSYIPLAKGHVNLAKPREDAEKWLQNMLKRPSNPIEITDQSLQDLILIIPKSPELLTEFYAKYYPIVGRKQIYPDLATQRLMAKDLPRYFHMGYPDEITEEKFSFALLFNPEDESLNLLLSNNGKCWVMDFTTLVAILQEIL